MYNEMFFFALSTDSSGENTAACGSSQNIQEVQFGLNWFANGILQYLLNNKN